MWLPWCRQRVATRLALENIGSLLCVNIQKQVRVFSGSQTCSRLVLQNIGSRHTVLVREYTNKSRVFLPVENRCSRKEGRATLRLLRADHRSVSYVHQEWPRVDVIRRSSKHRTLRTSSHRVVQQRRGVGCFCNSHQYTSHYNHSTWNQCACTHHPSTFNQNNC